MDDHSERDGCRNIVRAASSDNSPASVPSGLGSASVDVGLRKDRDKVDGADASGVESTGDGVGGESVVSDCLDLIAFCPFCDRGGDLEVID